MKWPVWLNRTVFGVGIASFFGDLGYESVTVLLPSFLIIIGAPVYALGVIEGLSDGASSFVKLFSGYYADKMGKRREFALGGSVATAVFPAIIAMAGSWFVVLVGRLVGWIGKGIRSPSRDAILSKSVDKADLGKAFGFHRAGDTLGAIVRPVIALVLLSSIGIREIFWLAVIPGFIALIALWLFLHEKNTAPHPRPRPIVASLQGLPSRFRAFLSAVLVFGIADFSHTLLIAFAIVSFTPALGFTMATAAGAALYLVRNIVYAASSYPFGLLGDRIGRRTMLILGYAIAVVTFIGFVLAPVNLVVVRSPLCTVRSLYRGRGHSRRCTRRRDGGRGLPGARFRGAGNHERDRGSRIQRDDRVHMGVRRIQRRVHRRRHHRRSRSASPYLDEPVSKRCRSIAFLILDKVCCS